MGGLFSGLGGFEYAAETVGFEIQFVAEIEPYCNKLLANRFKVPNLGNVSTKDWSNIEKVDVLCGGFPCQDISNAGYREGITGERSGLWKEYKRAILCLRPAYVLIENVSALLGRGMDVVLSDLAEIGYDAQWQVLSAAAIGAPHRRDRIWIVANSISQGVEGLQQSDYLSSAGPWGRSGKEIVQSLTRTSPYISRDSMPQPLLRRMVDGVPDRVDRIHALGNAIVPQCAEIFLRLIKDQLDIYYRKEVTLADD